MLKTSKFIIIAIGLVCFMFGMLTIVIIKKFSHFYFTNNISVEVSLLEIISLLVNGLLVVYVTRNLSKRNDQDKTEKEIVINYLKEFQTEYNARVNALIEKEDFESHNTNSCFKTLRKKINTILKFTEENKIIESNNETSHAIRQKISEVWEYFTDTPRVAGEKVTQEIKEGIQSLRTEKKGKIEAASIELDILILQLAIYINRK